LVTGGRGYQDYKKVFQSLDLIKKSCEEKRQFMIVIHGGARGADSLANRWCDDNEMVAFKFPARWRKEGKSAGPIRNRIMQNFLSEIRADSKRENEFTCLAFKTPGAENAGTSHMMEIMEKDGFDVIDVEEAHRILANLEKAP
jgi:hypothetical protein